jgi:hypothetical protein
MSAVELAGGRGAFYRAREATDGGGVLIPISFKGVKKEEEIGRHCFSGGVKAARQRFSSALHARRRVAVGGAGQSR